MEPKTAAPQEGAAYSWLQRIRRKAGLDRAIAYTVIGRSLQGLGSVATVLMIVHFLTPSEQGYYYALWSLVALQSVFELGFSFVILQVAAHERAHLDFHANGVITGDAKAHGRLASVLQRAVLWYAFAAVVMLLVLLIAGPRFFSLHAQAGDITAWVWPLRMAALACALTFSIGPVLSFLEGCGQVASVARMRLFQSVASTSAAWAAMLSHHGLFAPAMVLMGQGVVACFFLWSRRALLLGLLRHSAGAHAIRWRGEVWPFQWRIAVSWLCDYFIFQLMTPVLFAFRGPVEAGRMGVSMSIVVQMSGLLLIWMTTKAAPFGTLVAQRDGVELDRIFFHTLRQSLVLLAGCACMVLAGVMLIDRFAPAFSARFVSWPIFLLLLATAVSNHIVQSEALYLRAHKFEPFLVQSILIAAATAGSVLLLVKPWGAMGAASAYFAVMGVGGVISATLIFRTRRREWASTMRPEAVASI